MFGKCCICGTIKNCGKYLESVLTNINKISELFDECKIIFAYDKSSDNSLEILTKYASENANVTLYVEKRPLSFYRTHNIARARNKCLEIIRENYIDYEYFIMIDCDDVCASPVNIEPLKMYLNRTSEWDSISFNKKPYYDSWALSKYPYVCSNMHFADPEKYRHFMEFIIDRTPPGELIPCLSAFNGFAIYKTNKFISFYYDPIPRLDLIPSHLIKMNIQICGPMFLKGKAANVDCEHRSFHLMAINNGARIRIAPEVIFGNL